MKKLGMIITFIVVALLAVGCGKKIEDTASKASNEPYKLRYQGETGGVTPAELAEDLGYFKKVTLDYQGTYTGGPESIQFVATNQLDYGMSFNGAILKSIAKGVKIQSVITSYGSNEDVFLGFFAKKGSGIKSAQDLVGKKVAVNIRGAHYEMALREYLHQQGISKDQIEQVEFVTMPQINAEQAVINGQVDVAALNGLFREKAIERKQTELVFKDLDAFKQAYNAGSYFFKTDFIEKHPEEVKDFTQGVARALEWTKITDRKEVIQRFEKIMKERKRDEPLDNLQYFRGSGVETKGGKFTDEDFKRWIEPLQRVGDLQNEQVDTSTMYTNEFNPF